MYAIIPAAGSGLRMGRLTADRAKILLPIGKLGTVLDYTVSAIVASELCSGIVVAARAEDKEDVLRLGEKLALFGNNRVEFQVVTGGKRRQDSVRNALQYIPEDVDLVMVHDGARPFCSTALFRRVTEAAKHSGAAIAALPVKPTIKESADGTKVLRTLPRERLFETQTPQIFSAAIIRQAYQMAENDNFEATDDSQLVERLGEKVTLVTGEERNVKITTPFDLKLAELLLEEA